MLSRDSRPEDMIAFVQRWFYHMAEGRTELALAQCDEPNTYGVFWTGDAIEDVLSTNFNHGSYLEKHPEGPRFTSPNAALGRPRVDALEFDDGSGYSLEHHVPLNGEWSDLTAQFEFRRCAEGYAVVLHDLHVL